MKKVLTICIFVFVFSGALADDDMLIRDYGTFSFSGEGYDVTIELRQFTKGELAPMITFRKGEFMGKTGIGKGSSIPVVEGKWAVQFLPPNELWVFDGDSRIDLYERTSRPNGFKCSSSVVVPSLRDRAPRSLQEKKVE